MSEAPLPEVEDNPAEERLEARVGEHLAYLGYSRLGDRLFLLHTEVPEALGGRGLAGLLVRSALDRARADGARVVAFCPFAQSWLRRHPEYQDLLAPPTE